MGRVIIWTGVGIRKGSTTHGPKGGGAISGIPPLSLDAGRGGALALQIRRLHLHTNTHHDER